ncbi:DUF6457 domain-containing protein [Corynebacterium tapiri]|uniref:DUF6457 domain-containing protein n=1 Tax=Corynebacterium tapiri TaxID=1448266 RepID=UPI0015D5FD7D|nr:DUF6457 domain-containing protein [Corynebacterium tapiri]
MAVANDPDFADTRQWLAEVAEELGIDPTVVYDCGDELLRLTKLVAHNKARPAGPLTTFLIGLAAAQSETPVDEVATIVDKLAASIQES